MPNTVQMELRFVKAQIQSLVNSRIPENKQWFRIDEVAEIFAVSNTTVRNWVDQGTLEGRLISFALDKPERKHVRVTRESIVNLLNDNTRRVN